MSIAIALVEIPDLIGRVCQPNEVTLGEGNSITFNVNYAGDITPFNAAKRTIQYSVSGLSGTEVTSLQSLAETNLGNLVKKTDPSYSDIYLSGLLLEDSFLRSVKPSGSLTVDSEAIVEKTDLVYETKGRYLV
jgi:hypothetical protein